MNLPTGRSFLHGEGGGKPTPILKGTFSHEFTPEDVASEIKELTPVTPIHVSKLSTPWSRAT